MRINVPLHILSESDMGDPIVSINIYLSKYFKSNALSILKHKDTSAYIVSNILSEYLKKDIKDEEMEKIFLDKVVDFISAQFYRYTSLVNLINRCLVFMSQPYKDKILEIMLADDRYYGVLKKDFMYIALRLSYTEDLYIKSISYFKSTLDAQCLHDIKDRVAGGVDHPDIKKIFTGSRLEILLLQDNKKILNHISKYSSSVDFLDHAIDVSIDDLKEMHPATRFKFLYSYYKSDFKWIMGGRLSSITRNRIRDGRSKLILPRLSDDELNTLVFPYAMKGKNLNNVSKFITNYKAFREAVSNIPDVYIT